MSKYIEESVKKKSVKFTGSGTKKLKVNGILGQVRIWNALGISATIVARLKGSNIKIVDATTQTNGWEMFSPTYQHDGTGETGHKFALDDTLDIDCQTSPQNDIVVEFMLAL